MKLTNKIAVVTAAAQAMEAAIVRQLVLGHRVHVDYPAADACSLEELL